MYTGSLKSAKVWGLQGLVGVPKPAETRVGMTGSGSPGGFAEDRRQQLLEGHKAGGTAETRNPKPYKPETETL